MPRAREHGEIRLSTRAEARRAIFEFIDPGNRIVVDYGDYSGLVLLGAVDNKDGSDHFTPADYAATTGWEGRQAVPRQFNLQAMLRTVQDPENGPNREGFVLVWLNPDGPSTRVKIKFAQYVHLHSVLSRLNNVAVWEALKMGTFDALYRTRCTTVSESAQMYSQRRTRRCTGMLTVTPKQHRTYRPSAKIKRLGS